MRHRLVGISASSLLVVLLSLTSAWAQAVSTAQINGTVRDESGGGLPGVTITVTHKMSQAEADKYTGAFAKGGVAALRKALTGVAPTGSIQIGSGKPAPTSLTLERPSDRGRLLTIVTSQPLMFIGAGLPEAKAKEGFDFGIVDLVVADNGTGSGTMSPAAKVTVKQGVFVIDEYSGELVRLTNVKKVK